MTARDAILSARCWNGPAARPSRSRIIRLSRLLPLAATAHGAQAASTGAGVTSSACVMQRDMVASSDDTSRLCGSSALMLDFPTVLNYPIQVAVGAIQHTVPLAFTQTAVSLAALIFAAHYGIRAVALSTFTTVPFNVGLSVLVVRAHVSFPWSEFTGATTKSAVVAGLSAVGPLAVIGTIGLRVLPIAVATGLGGVGWPFGGPR